MTVSKPIPKFDTSSTRPDLPLPRREAAAARTTRRQDFELQQAQLAGVTPEPDVFNIMILNYTMKCPLACDYCCYHCSPKRTETMDFALAVDLVDQAHELNVFKQFAFTGGEPLIFYDEVMQLTERMWKYNRPFSIISACYWATTPQEARRVLTDLARHGIDVFSVTHDPSHENWVPLQYIRNAVDAALELNIHVCLCSSFYDDTMRLEHIFPEYVGNPNIDFVNRVVLPEAGRAARRKISLASYGAIASRPRQETCYKRIYHDVTVFWDGEVYPCCSVYNRSTKRLSYGNTYKERLSDIWDRIDGSLLLRIIKRQGFGDLYRLIGRSDPDLLTQLPDPQSTVGACHLCHLIFRDPTLYERIDRVIEAHERQRIKELLDSVKRSSGSESHRNLIENTLRAVGQPLA
ncbi:MAG TPA: radical SAM protein [Stellaceae bacterium]|nr:radical SAM protein [Stellaceae bacterium]